MSRPTVAIVGTGISGLAAAHFLQRDFDLKIFEKESRVGGHSNTVEVTENGQKLPLDTGFMVYNEVTYPLLTRLFAELEVETKPTSMSFSVRREDQNLEFNGGSLNLLFSQRKNLFRPRFWKMLLQIGRFNTETLDELENPKFPALTLGQYVQERGYGRDFLDWYLSPMAAAVWSTPPDRMEAFPAHTLLRFWHNHGFLGLDTQHPWRTVSGGSREYLKKLTGPLADRITTDNAVVSITGKTLTLADQSTHTFDHLILAVHGDQALPLVTDATPLEKSVLAPFRYQKNQAVVHSDPRFMPKNKRTWASWNYRVQGDSHSTHYWMNSLQGVSEKENYFVSINPPEEPHQVHHRLEYEHPLFDLAAIAAQARLPELHQAGHTTGRFYCGAWQRYGFHEDGIWSAHRLCQALTGKASFS